MRAREMRHQGYRPRDDDNTPTVPGIRRSDVAASGELGPPPDRTPDSSTSSEASGFESFWTGLSDSRRGWIVIVGVFVAVVVVISAAAGSTPFRDDFSYEAGYDFGRAGRAIYQVEGSREEVTNNAFGRCLSYQLHAKGSSDGHRIDDGDFMDGCMDAFGVPR